MIYNEKCISSAYNKYTNIVKGESNCRKLAFEKLPNRILYYTNIVKTEGRVSNLFVNFAEVHPIFYKYTQNVICITSPCFS
jgi:hypothetical protein